MRLKTLIADDEPLARERLRLLLSSDSEIEITKECRNGREVVESLKSLPVDLLLLDIQMPAMNGLEIVQSIGPMRMPMTVFVTAHSEHAVKAFEVHALDYLVKPVEANRLHEAVERAKERIRLHQAFVTSEQFASVLKVLQNVAGARGNYPQRFLAKSGNKDSVVTVAEIEWIEAADYYVCVHAYGKPHLLRESIKAFETKLDPAKFVRLHRSAIVNIDFVREIHRDGLTGGWVLLSTGVRVRMNKAGWRKLVAMNSFS